MRQSIDIVYRGIDNSAALNHTISQKLDKLQRYTDHIIHGRLVIETPHKQRSKGKQYRVTAELQINGDAITVSHDDGGSIHVAVRDAFKAVERKIKQLSERRVTARHATDFGIIGNAGQDSEGSSAVA